MNRILTDGTIDMRTPGSLRREEDQYCGGGKSPLEKISEVNNPIIIIIGKLKAKLKTRF